MMDLVIVIEAVAGVVLIALILWATGEMK